MARGLSGYFDALIDNRISRNLAAAFPIDMHFLADYPDFLAFSVVVILTALLSFGVKESSLLNNFFTAINLTTICIALFCGALNGKRSMCSFFSQNSFSIFLRNFFFILNS